LRWKSVESCANDHSYYEIYEEKKLGFDETGIAHTVDTRIKALQMLIAIATDVNKQNA